jgi:hypothetical protein
LGLYPTIGDSTKYDIIVQKLTQSIDRTFWIPQPQMMAGTILLQANQSFGLVPPLHLAPMDFTTQTGIRIEVDMKAYVWNPQFAHYDWEFVGSVTQDVYFSVDHGTEPLQPQ